ncbi:tetratricopeptide repeat protein [Kitasatospora sp. NBC_00240]|uniref:tetratricopeptide repeat protein n=1 Tax=Kitasatospora sp. NBC_00240 TaxID=2903567 RepID=UPI00225217A1|nr:tetratricopeptide repeat protein [Kitasatospora sp. NBC_00240]MCX5212870.1 tetratricopeptide repeat protein [Kitasatospora sp. NBC_00240]
MTSRTGFFALSAVLLLVAVICVGEGVQLIATGKPLGIGLGLCAFVIPGIGVWFLRQTVRFGRASERMARELEAEGGLPVDELRRTPGGRIDRASADEVFARRQEEAETTPGDWRVWFRLAVAYADAGDTPRARKTMQHAIRLHAASEPAPVAG